MKSNFKFVVSTIFLMIVSVFLFTGCPQKPESDVKDKVTVKCTVTFNSNGGTTIDPITVEKGEKITEPIIPTKAGKNFEGWFLDENSSKKWVFNTDVVNKDITLHARWAGEFWVIFDSLGGPKIPTQAITGGETATEPSPWPERDGYKFRGWYTDKEFKTEYNFDNPVTQDITVYAKWARLYKVVFDSNGGSEVKLQEIAEDETDENRKVTKPTHDPIRLGYSFVEWQKDGSKYDFGTLVNSDITLKAKWKPEPYSVTINPNGGTLEGSSTEQEINITTDETSNSLNKILSAKVLTKENAIFAGWCSDAECTTPVIFDSFMSIKGKTLYAKWYDLVTVESSGKTFGMGKDGNKDSKYGSFNASFTKNYQVNPYETTRELYSAVMFENLNGFSIDPSTKKDEDFLPVQNVSWDNSIVFCNRLSKIQGLSPVYSLNGETDTDKWEADEWDQSISTETYYKWYAVKINKNANGFRLPSEAEWEYAARGGNPDYVYIGTNDKVNVGNYSWYSKNSDKVIKLVGGKTDNGFDLFDMGGNALEWVFDWNEGYPKNTDQSDYIKDERSTTDTNTRTLRGGSGKLGDFALKAYYRRSATQKKCDYWYSFRVVKNEN